MPIVCSVTLKTWKGHPTRAVGFLAHSDVSFVNVSEVFNRLGEDVRDYFRTSFDYFLEDLTLTKYPHRYHGWKKTVERGIYQHCFVFKCPPHRLYGFLCHPKGMEDGRFYACALVLHAEKLKWLTDKEELKRVNKMREDAEVLKAIRWPWKEDKKK